jgi:hypothetical protein
VGLPLSDFYLNRYFHLGKVVGNRATAPCTIRRNSTSQRGVSCCWPPSPPVLSTAVDWLCGLNDMRVIAVPQTWTKMESGLHVAFLPKKSVYRVSILNVFLFRLAHVNTSLLSILLCLQGSYNRRPSYGR